MNEEKDALAILRLLAEASENKRISDDAQQYWYKEAMRYKGEAERLEAERDELQRSLDELMFAAASCTVPQEEVRHEDNE